MQPQGYPGDPGPSLVRGVPAASPEQLFGNIPGSRLQAPALAMLLQPSAAARADGLLPPPPTAETVEAVASCRPPECIIVSGPDFYKPHITCLYGGYKRTRNLYGKATYQKDPDQGAAGQQEAFIYWSAVDSRWCVSTQLGATIMEKGELGTIIDNGADELPVPLYQLQEDEGSYPRLLSPWVANLFGYGARYQAEHMITLEGLELPLEASDPAKSVGGYMHICTRRFVDYCFPPKLSSLVGDPAPIRIRNESVGAVTWVPAQSSAVEKSGPLFRGTTEPRGDWLEGVPPERGGIYPILSALHEYPGHLESLLAVSPEVNRSGCYHVQLYDVWQKAWRRVTVDDFTPQVLEMDGSRLVPFSGGSGRTLWACILEKAVAKLCGSFEALGVSHPGPLLMTFTGQGPSAVSHWVRDGGWWSRWQFMNIEPRKITPSHQRVRDTRPLKCVRERVAGTWHQGSDLFATMRQLHRQNALILAYTDPGKEFGGERLPGRDHPNVEGMVIGHGYSVLQLVEVQDDIAGASASGPLLLVQLRNIWGADMSWQGAWGEGSAEWDRYPEIRRHYLREEYRNTGRFWMCWQDFCAVFDRIEVCPMPEAARKASYAPPKANAARSKTRGVRTRGLGGGSGGEEGGAGDFGSSLLSWTRCCTVEKA